MSCPPDAAVAVNLHILEIEVGVVVGRNAPDLVVLDDDGGIDYTIKFKEIVSVETLRKLLPFIDQYIDEVIEGVPY
jgi:hypothetical protein